MSRATRHRGVLPLPARERLLSLVLYYRSIRRVALVLRLTQPLVRRAVVGRALRPWQVRAVTLSLRGGA